jgi:N-acetylmuramoyl-L-alanine amidase
MLPAVTRSRLSSVQLLILLLVSPALSALANKENEQPLFPLQQSGVGTVVIDGRQAPLEFGVTAAGALVSLQPLIAQLGGTLEQGPLLEYHRLELGDTVFLFGPGSLTMTAGEEIVDLSQPPMMGAVGIQVPLDLLRETYGRELAYDFRWDGTAHRLEVSRQTARDIPVSVDAVQLQGVTTLVFEFPTQPRYRIRREGRLVAVETIGDTLHPEQRRPLPPDRLIKSVRVRDNQILIELAAQTAADDYVLENPFRLVFDVHHAEGSASTAASTPAAPAAHPMTSEVGAYTIVLDPGHGGSDTGAHGPAGSLEKNLTLILARTLKRRLEDRLPVEVVLTRDDDEELPLDSRAAVANQHKAALFISIHLNSAPSAGAQGAETYFLSLDASDELAAAAADAENQALVAEGGTADEGDPLRDLQLILWDLAQSHHLAESQRLASLIQEELNLTLSLRDRGVKQAPFRVLMGAAMPAVLVELGFLTDPVEEQQLNDPEYRSRLVDTLVRAIVRYRAAETDSLQTPQEAIR